MPLPPLAHSLLSMQMMARLQLWTMGLLAAVVFTPAITTVSGLLVVEAENPVPIRTARKETQSVLSRQKRDWIWNSLYVEEEKPAPVAYKIGQVGLPQIYQWSRLLSLMLFLINCTKILIFS